MKLKIFWLLLLLTFGLGVYMVVLSFDLKKEERRQNKVEFAKESIEKWSNDIGVLRAKEKSQKDIGNVSMEITEANISMICSRNKVQMERFNEIKPIDRNEYLEAGYNIKIKGVSKKNLAVIFWEIEDKIRGSKIKSVRMNRSTKIKKYWNVTFIIIKSIQKPSEEESSQ